MDEEPMLAASPSPILTFFRKVMHRFTFGDTPFSDFGQMREPENPNFIGLNFDLHPGPVAEAITDAKNLQKLLCIYVYCVDNPTSNRVDKLFKRSPVAAKISSNFVFYAAPITSSDGYRVAVGSKFEELPLLTVVNPSGNTLSECPVLSKNEGLIDEDGLVSILSAEFRHESETDRIRAEQDAQYHEAELEMQRREAQEPDIVEIPPPDLFSQLPELSASDENTCTVKFHFPDNVERTKVFSKDGNISMLFTFARHFVGENTIHLYTGFPMKEFTENDGAIKQVCDNAQFLVYVLKDDV